MLTQTIIISLRVERMDTVMTRQALFQARIFRKSKIREQMIKLEQLVSCPNVLLKLGDFFIAQVLEIATKFSMYRMFSVMLKCGVKNMQLLFSTSSVSVLEMLN